MVKSIILETLYSPAQYPALMKSLDGLISGNLTAAVDLGSSSGDLESSTNASSRTSTFDEFAPVVDRAYSVSRFDGDKVPATSMQCAWWKMAAKERFGGNFDVTTRQPVLLMGNAHDPVTPLVSAKNLCVSLRGSVILEQHGFGVRFQPNPQLLRHANSLSSGKHAFVAQASRCTAKVIQQYFLHGTLPKHGKVCPVDDALF
ncbi:hypothetical protein DCS_05812 [Drechmeria coniospora]|uniref:Peptidase S33 tripeptidyl aminopeptidase-like C-terminal domain-containing protein n=1 Tax=Drechmeria coniospora TaxID=98403 RepID=A0A151GNV2_DRECN|nr:hypothetical protein DCS_05812 [Drechmeria coniospora]KYK58794.1 hypothetical protein DCS_05812 [Drechmeria coniospora]